MLARSVILTLPAYAASEILQVTRLPVGHFWAFIVVT